MGFGFEAGETELMAWWGWLAIYVAKTKFYAGNVLTVIVIIGLLVAIGFGIKSCYDWAPKGKTENYETCKASCAQRLEDCIFQTDVVPETCANISNRCLYNCKDRFQ